MVFEIPSKKVGCTRKEWLLLRKVWWRDATQLGWVASRYTTSQFRWSLKQNTFSAFKDICIRRIGPEIVNPLCLEDPWRVLMKAIPKDLSPNVIERGNERPVWERVELLTKKIFTFCSKNSLQQLRYLDLYLPTYLPRWGPLTSTTAFTSTLVTCRTSNSF